MYIRFTILITLLLSFAIIATPQAAKEQQKTLLARSRERCVYIDTEDGFLTGTIIAHNIVITNFHGLEVDSKITILHETEGIIDYQKEAKVLAVDPEHDLVLLIADTPDIRPVRFSTKLELWQEVFSIGYPRGIIKKGSPKEKDTPLKSIVPGVITALSDTRIYTNINPGKGMSGSMAYDLATGDAIGIQVELVGSVDGNFHSSGAIPATTILAFIKNSSKNLNSSFQTALREILEQSK